MNEEMPIAGVSWHRTAIIGSGPDSTTTYTAGMSIRFAFAARAGLSVVEVLVALLLVTVALLGIAGTVALSVRSSAAAARERRAVQRVAARIARLEGEGCGTARGGEVAADFWGMRERWTLQPARSGAELFDESIEWLDGSHSRTLRVESALLC